MSLNETGNVVPFRRNFDLRDIEVKIASFEIDHIITQYLRQAGYIQTDEEVMVIDLGIPVDEDQMYTFDVTVEVCNFD